MEEEKISGDHRKVEADEIGEVEVEEIESISVTHNTYLKSPWPDVSEAEPEVAVEDIKNYAEEEVLPRPPRTNRFPWYIALLIAGAIILAAMALLILYLTFHPRFPRLELTHAVLKRIVLDRTTYLFKTEMAAFLKFRNPNGRVDLRYEDINFKLYFRDDIIATQVLGSFSQHRGNTSDGFVLLMVSPNYTELAPLSGLIMEHQIVKKGTIVYKLLGKMTTIMRLGKLKRIHYEFYLTCQLQFSVPPKSVLRHQECTTNHKFHRNDFF